VGIRVSGRHKTKKPSTSSATIRKIWSSSENGPDQSLKRTIPDLPWGLKGNDGHLYIAPVGKYEAKPLRLARHARQTSSSGAPIAFRFYDPIRKPDQESAVRRGFCYVHRGGNWFNAPDTAGAGVAAPGRRPIFRNSLTGFSRRSGCRLTDECKPGHSEKTNGSPDCGRVRTEKKTTASPVEAGSLTLVDSDFRDSSCRPTVEALACDRCHHFQQRNCHEWGRAVS